jgi:hypothetical protein
MEQPLGGRASGPLLSEERKCAVSRAPCETVLIRERATLRLDDGQELRVEVDRDDLDRDEIVVRRADNDARHGQASLEVIDQHLASATRHPAGTTDRLLDADRDRPY